MKIADWVPKGIHLSPSTKRDCLLFAGFYLINCVQFSAFDQLAHVWTRPWLLWVWLYGLVGLAPLMWRDRAPVAVFAVQWVLAVAAWPILHYYTPVVGLMVALYAVSVQRSRWLSLLLLLTSFIPFGLDALMIITVQADLAAGLAASVPWVIIIVVVAGWAWGAGRLTRKVQQHVQFLERERAVTREAEALAKERRRIARELHDIVSHAVTVMVVQAGGAARIAETDFRQVTQSLVHIETHGKQAMAELRRLLSVLEASDPPSHGTGLGALEPQPGLADLPALLSSLRAAGMLVAIHTVGTPGDLDPGLDLTAYRIVQEALTNVLKHAGIDANPRLRLTWQAQSLHIQVDNHLNPTKTHHGLDLPGGRGLIGLRERAHTVGGRLHAGPHRDGYRLTAILPLVDTAQLALLDHRSG
ncbi:MAG: sensor histidine kinase [Pseudonocardiaceae bacterium]